MSDQPDDPSTLAAWATSSRWAMPNLGGLVPLDPDAPTTIAELIEATKPHELIHFRDVMRAQHVFGLITTDGAKYETSIDDDRPEAVVVAEMLGRLARTFARPG